MKNWATLSATGTFILQILVHSAQAQQSGNGTAGRSGTAQSRQVELDETLKPLETLVGTWQVSSHDPKEAKFAGVFKVEADPGGRSIVATMAPANLSNDPGVKPAFFIRTVWYFDPASKQIVSVWAHSDGSSGFDTSPKQPASEKEVIIKGSGTTADGKKLGYTGHVKWIDKDTFLYWDTDIVQGGEKQPDSPKYTNKRVKSTLKSAKTP